MAKSKQQKQKERERRVAKQKLAEAAKIKAARKADKSDDKTESRNRKVLTAGVKQAAQVASHKPQVTHRRTGG